MITLRKLKRFIRVLSTWLAFVLVFAVGPWIMLPEPAEGATLNVPGSYATIQAGINAASNGDTVLVADGTYSENIDFSGKNITVQSENGASSTKIQGSGSYNTNPVVSFTNSETSSAILDGFTLDNQQTTSSSRGIYVSGATPTIQNCTIEGNCADNGNGGGGVYINNSAPSFDNVTIRANTAINRNGGGMYITGAAGGATITNSTIGGTTSGDGNDCGVNDGRGGGIYFTGSTSGTLSISNSNIQYNSVQKNGGGIHLNSITNTTTITNTTILNNSVGAEYAGGIYTNSPLTITGGSISNNSSSENRGGGGLHVASTTVSITGTTINSNSTGTYGGGGIYVTGTAPSLTLSECYVQGNSTTIGGGNGNGAGIGLLAGTATITNCVISGNSTNNSYWSSGGGLYVEGATANVYHSTFAGNWANRRGGGIYVASGATATFNSSLLWDNVASDADTYDIKDDGNATVDYSAIESGSGYTGANNVTSITGTVFTTPAAASYGNPTTSGDFHIKSDATEIINTADPSSSVTDDIDGDSRPQNSGYDMGSDELVTGVTEEWIYTTGATSLSAPSVYPSSGYAVMGTNNSLDSISTTNGSQRSGFPYSISATVQSRAPIVTVGATPTIYAAADDGYLYAVDASDGSLVWSKDVAGAGNELRGGVARQDNVINGEDYLFVGTYNPGSATTNKVYALCTTTDNGRTLGEVAWSTSSSMDVVESTPATDWSNNRVYVTSKSNSGTQPSLWAINTTDGSVAWSKSLGDITSSPVVSGGYVYVGTDSGTLYKYDTDGTEQWNFTISSKVQGFPWPQGGKVYVSTASNGIYKLTDGASSASQDWNVSNATIASPSYPLIVKGLGKLFAGSSDGNLYSVALSDGAVGSSTYDGSSTVGNPTLDTSKGYIYVGTNTDKKVHAVSAYEF